MASNYTDEFGGLELSPLAPKKSKLLSNAISELSDEKNDAFRSREETAQLWMQAYTEIFGNRENAKKVFNLGEAVHKECRKLGFVASGNPFIGFLKEALNRNFPLEKYSYNAIHNAYIEDQLNDRELNIKSDTRLKILSCPDLYRREGTELADTYLPIYAAVKGITNRWGWVFDYEKKDKSRIIDNLSLIFDRSRKVDINNIQASSGVSAVQTFDFSRVKLREPTDVIAVYRALGGEVSQEKTKGKVNALALHAVAKEIVREFNGDNILAFKTFVLYVNKRLLDEVGGNFGKEMWGEFYEGISKATNNSNSSDINQFRTQLGRNSYLNELIENNSEHIEKVSRLLKVYRINIIDYKGENLAEFANDILKYKGQ